jgi:DNA-directed RNA polymerase subunit K/omega
MTPAKVENIFLKVLIVSQRAKQIQKGAVPLVDRPDARATRIALEEVERGLIDYEFKDLPLLPRRYEG